MSITVHIKENQVTEAEPDAAIVYGWMTTSISITCLLEDGSKVGAHAVLFGCPGGVLINKMKELIKSRKVVKVIAVGHGRYWGPELQDQITLVSLAKKVWNMFTSKYEELEMSYENLIENMKPLLITSNIKKFKMWLEAQFSTNNIDFKNLEKETFISIEKNGNALKSNISIEKL